MKFWVVPSENVSNRVFVIRDDRTEIQVDISEKGLLKPSIILTPKESNYIVDKYVKIVDKDIFNTVINKHLSSSITDIEIARELNYHESFVSRIIRDYWKNKKIS